ESVALGYGSVVTANRQVQVGGRTLAGVNAGALAAGSTEAVNGAQLFAIDEQVSANTSAIAALQAGGGGGGGVDLTPITTDIAALQTQNGAQQAQIDANVSGLAAVEAHNTAQQGQIDANTSGLVAVQAQAAAQQAQIDVNSSGVAANTADINGLQAQAAVQQTQIDDANTR